ncbi:hypothetical protein GCM10023189_26310 [Nibrella saemangeumensis]|uniref:Outer membrane protein beta-barrel domain-containing protein n=1 Tax=Nibrella saemangeumensis TaxID=1084526 RepID=A0ABP8MV77_9BACT
MKQPGFISCLFTLLLASVAGYGQRTFISAGGEAAFPGKGLEYHAGTGFGGSLRFQFAWGEHVAGMATIGYVAFAEKSISVSSTRLRAVPIQVGVKYYLRRRTEHADGFFLSAELGLMPVTRRVTYQSGFPGITRKNTDLSFAAGLGYQLGRFEPSLRFQYNLPDAGYQLYYLNFRLAYTFLRGKT